MSISLQGYLDRISSLGIVQLPQQNDNQALINSQPQDSDKDSYIPSMASADVIMPSGSYNASGMESEDTVQIQTVIINGMQYREITRTENGNEITTRELIGTVSDNE